MWWRQCSHHTVLTLYLVAAMIPTDSLPCMASCSRRCHIAHIYEAAGNALAGMILGAWIGLAIQELLSLLPLGLWLGAGCVCSIWTRRPVRPTFWTQSAFP